MVDLISVIIPVYNVKNYVVQCVESVLNQTYKNLQIIIVDDGSTDGSGALCDSFIERDKRVEVIHKENGGLSDARNAGIEIAKGEYLTFVDSDDTIAPETIEKMHNAASQNSAEIAVCNMIRVNDCGEKYPFYCPAHEVKVLNKEDRFLTLRQPSACNKLFRTDLFESVRFPVGKYYEDTFVYHELVYKASSAVLTGYDGYYYMIRENSILGSTNYTNRYFDFIEAVHERAEFLIEKKVDHYAEEACLSLYVAMNNAVRNIPEDEQNKVKFIKAFEWYDSAYRFLMKKKGILLRQRIRLVLLRYTPKLHCLIYKG